MTSRRVEERRFNKRGRWSWHDPDRWFTGGTRVATRDTLAGVKTTKRSVIHLPPAGLVASEIVSENSFKTRNRRHVRSRPMETPRGNREGVIDESEKIFDDVSHRIFETDRRLFSGVIGVVTRLRNQPRVAESSGRMLESVWRQKEWFSEEWRLNEAESLIWEDVSIKVVFSFFFLNQFASLVTWAIIGRMIWHGERKVQRDTLRFLISRCKLKIKY